jgi:hypothetical protein
MKVLVAGLHALHVDPAQHPEGWTCKTETDQWLLSDEGVFVLRGQTLHKVELTDVAASSTGFSFGKAWLDRSTWEEAQACARFPVGGRWLHRTRRVYKAHPACPVALITEETNGGAPRVHFRVTGRNTTLDVVEREISTLLSSLKSC